MVERLMRSGRLKLEVQHPTPKVFAMTRTYRQLAPLERAKIELMVSVQATVRAMSGLGHLKSDR